MDAERARALLAAERARLNDVKQAADRLTTQAVEATAGELSRVPQHAGDLGSEVEEREKDLAVRDKVDAQLTELDAAEQRLAAGSYGRCEVCGKPIPDERLEAMPATRYCVEDQARMERETAV